MNLPDQRLGFQTSLFIFNPLPRTKVGTEFRREVNGILCIYLDPLGVPYTTNDRRWFEVVTTLAKRAGKPLVALGSVSQALMHYGMDRSSRYILPAKNALLKLANLHISTMRVGKTGAAGATQLLNFAVTERAQILWGRGKADIAPLELFDGENFVELSSAYMNLVNEAVPHVQEHYMNIQSPLTLDVYKWVILKLYTLKEERELVRWTWIYAQFGQGGKLNESQMKSMRRLIKASLLEVITKYYPRARIEIATEGIIFKKSPPLIEPDNKRAGFSLL